MTTAEFEAHVQEKCNNYVNLNYCVIALNEEAGEVAGWYKKAVLRDNSLNLTDIDLKGELGDVLFYLTALSSTFGWTLSDIMEFNKVKLDERVAKAFKQVV